MDNRYIVIHAHMYQPPRENPWLEAIETQDSASPYHDWNERVSAECYAANAHARILDDKGRISRIVNNYKDISFNFGPTLLSWMEEFSRPVYEAVIEADRTSRERHSGHGNAIAQCYNHMIMPLASSRDKVTQVAWGIEDFRRRFSRDPEGMWLPETAVDTETLEALAGQGIKFTILSPGQAHHVKAPWQDDWTHVDENSIDTTMPYLIRLPSGAQIAAFFYNGPVSRAIAFEGLLKSGVLMAERLAQIFTGEQRPQLAHIATDGESYGHHSRFGDMALAYCVHHIRKNNLAKVANYGEFLEKHPPQWEVRIKDNTSWSCFHGVERWRSDCGCSTGGHPEWNQKWRAPLRKALDWLSGRLAEVFEKRGKDIFKDPWQARDRYIEVVLERAEERVLKFLESHALKKQNMADRGVEALRLLEMQRHAMLMFTSCGWFFDDIAGIEALQVLQYACRALQLCRELTGEDFEGHFLQILTKAQSNVKESGDGAGIYNAQVKVKTIDLGKVAVHYAISSLFEDYARQHRLYCYDVTRLDYETLVSGPGAASPEGDGEDRLAAGRINVRSRITWEDGKENGGSGIWQFAVLKKRGHEIVCVLSAGGPAKEYEYFKKAVKEMAGGERLFSGRTDLEVLKPGVKKFAYGIYTMRDLFLDEQRKVLEAVVSETLEESMIHYAQIYERARVLMGLLKDFRAPIPKPFLVAAEMSLVRQIANALREETVDMQKTAVLREELKKWGLELDAGLEPVLRERLKSLFASLREKGRAADLKALRGLVRFTSTLPFPVNLWAAQNGYWELGRSLYKKGGQGKREQEKEWSEEFRGLGEDLHFSGEAVRRFQS